MTKCNYLLSLVLGAALGLSINIVCANAADTIWTRACGTHAGLYFCSEYRAAVPLPRIRPVIPCDTDSDCMAKNGGDGYMGPCDTDSDDYCDSFRAPAADCYDPQDDDTYGKNGILCRDGEDY